MSGNMHQPFLVDALAEPTSSGILVLTVLPRCYVPRRCHGFAAAVGKAGALVAGVVFGKVNDQTKFWISAACGFAGVVCTLILIPGEHELPANAANPSRA